MLFVQFSGHFGHHPEAVEQALCRTFPCVLDSSVSFS